MKRFAVLCTLFVAAALPAQTKVDSIVYDKGTEWKLFRSEGPCTHFTLQGTILWLSTEDKVTSVSVVAATPKASAFKPYSTLGSLASSGVSAMATDSTGCVWFGTASGVAVLKGAAFTVYTDQNGLCNNEVTAIMPMADGRVFVGTKGGLCLFRAGSWSKYTTSQGLRNDEVKCMAVDHRGALWVGTPTGISVLLDGKWSSQTMKEGMSWNDTKALAFDPRTKKMWAAVGEQDVNCYDGKAWQVYMGIQDGLTSIMADSQSRIWFGSGSVLTKFNGEEWITDPSKLGVPCKLVPQMHRDGSGNLWFASENGVVFLKNPYPF